MLIPKKVIKNDEIGVFMNIFVLIVFIIEAILGVGSSIGIVALLIGTLISKFVRKAKYGTSLFK